MSLLEVRRQATDSEEGGREYLFGCDWSDCPATIICSGSDAEDAEHHLKKHGSWGSRSTEGLYCESHTPLAREKASREARGAVIAPLNPGTLADTAARCLREGYLFGEDLSFAETTKVYDGCVVLETTGGKKFLLMAWDITEEGAEQDTS